MTNKELIAQAFAALAQGDGTALVGLLADDVVWTIPGSSSWSGSRHGKAEVFATILIPLSTQLTASANVVADRILADGDFVVVQAHGHNNTTHAGKPYNNTYCFIFRFDGSLIREITEYADTVLIDSALAPPAH